MKNSNGLQHRNVACMSMGESRTKKSFNKEKRKRMKKTHYKSLLILMLLLVGVFGVIQMMGQKNNESIKNVLYCIDDCQKFALNFLDANTGYQIAPDLVEIYNSEGKFGFLENEDFKRGTSTVIELPTGNYYFKVYSREYMTHSESLDRAISITRENLTESVRGYDVLLKPIEIDWYNTSVSESEKEDGFLKAQGVVTDYFGLPIQNAKVSVLNADFGGVLFETHTDSRGFYKIRIPVTDNSMLYSKHDIQFVAEGYDVKVETRPMSNSPSGFWTPRLKPKGFNLDNIDISNLRVYNADFLFEINQYQNESSVYCEQDFIRVAMDCTESCNTACDLESVQIVPIDVYVQSVVPSEWIGSWVDFGGDDNGIEAFKAACMAIT